MNEQPSARTEHGARARTAGATASPTDRIAAALDEAAARLAVAADDGEADRLKKRIQSLNREKAYLALSSAVSGGGGADLIQPRHADAETAVFPDLTDGETPVVKQRALKVCIVTLELDGPDTGGDIGIADRRVAELLAAAGHRVTILYCTGDAADNDGLAHWVEEYKVRGIDFVPLPEPGLSMFRGLLRATGRVSRCVYEWLKDRDFDLVHVADWQGAGYYSLLAKHQGLAFRDTLFCVKCARPTMWRRIGGADFPRDRRELIHSFIERRSVELADIAVSGSQHMFRWMLSSGYDLDRERCRVQPDPASAESGENGGANDHPGDRLQKIDEFVFVGEMVPHKGFLTFCEALNRLTKTGALPDKVTFAGRTGKAFDARAMIDGRRPHWPFEVAIETGWNATQLRDYLRGDGRLAVVPSLLESASFTLRDCLSHDIRFLAGDRGVNPELVAAEDHGAVLFEIHPAALCRRMEDALRDGAAAVRPAIDDAASRTAWESWHARLTEPDAIRTLGRMTGFTAPGDKPLVSVCLAHYERPQLVPQAIASIEAQTYDNYEVIVVDDGSTSAEAVTFLADLGEQFAARGWQVVRQENSYLGASRNTAVRHASGDYLLFMDDDNVAKPHEIETFLKVAQTTKADILTSFSDVFEGDEPPSKDNVVSRITPFGADIALGMFVNGFGDSNCFVRRSAFEKIGGFTEDYRIGRDDQEFFARAVLSGLTLDVVPEALYWYRQPVTGKGMKAMNYSQMAGEQRVLRPYVSSLPLAYRDVLHYALGLEHETRELSAKLRQANQKLRTLQQTRTAPKKTFLARLLGMLAGRR